jgi:hypothetical protein
VEGQTKTWHYKQDNIHDFAWFASKDFKVDYDTVVLPSKKVVDVFSYYKPATAKRWNKSIEYAKDGLRSYSRWVGDYPYTIASIVQEVKMKIVAEWNIQPLHSLPHKARDKN